MIVACINMHIPFRTLWCAFYPFFITVILCESEPDCRLYQTSQVRPGVDRMLGCRAGHADGPVVRQTVLRAPPGSPRQTSIVRNLFGEFAFLFEWFQQRICVCFIVAICPPASMRGWFSASGCTFGVDFDRFSDTRKQKLTFRNIFYCPDTHQIRVFRVLDHHEHCRLDDRVLHRAASRLPDRPRSLVVCRLRSLWRRRVTLLLLRRVWHVGATWRAGHGDASW